MTDDSSRNHLSFVPRLRGGLHRAERKDAGFVVPVRDLVFKPATGRIVAYRVAAPGTPTGEGNVAAIFTTPLADGRVRVPPAQTAGWLRKQALDGLSFSSELRGMPVIDCTGDQLGRVDRLVVDHLRQLVNALLLDDGSRVAFSDVLILSDGRALVEAHAVERSPTRIWLHWQDDIETGRLWWDGQLAAPPPLRPAARIAAAR